jgi:hypothetical protein
MNYELTAETLRFLLGITHNGTRREVVVTMKPYQNGHLIQLLKEREAALVQSQADLDALDLQATGAREANAEFFDGSLNGKGRGFPRHCLSITVDGKEASQAVIEKLDAMYKVKTMSIGLGYLGVRDVKDDAEVEQTGQKSLEEEFGEDAIIKHEFMLVDESGTEQTIKIGHNLRFPTVEDRIRWDRAQKVQAMKEGGRRTRYNYEAIGHLYDAMIAGVTGFVLAGQACTAANKPEWIKLLPYIFKFRAMDSLFQLATEKNG